MIVRMRCPSGLVARGSEDGLPSTWGLGLRLPERKHVGSKIQFFSRWIAKSRLTACSGELLGLHLSHSDSVRCRNLMSSS